MDPNQNRYYVYAHYTLDTNELFYIGKGTRGRAFQLCKVRNRFWESIKQKHGVRVEILIDGLGEVSAYMQEYFYIKMFKPKANFSIGGTDPSKEVRIAAAKRMPDSTKKSRSEALKKRWEDPVFKAETSKKISNSLTGKKLSPEHKKKALEALKIGRARHTSESRQKAGIAISKALKGKKKSPEHAEKIRKNRIGTKNTSSANLKRAISSGSKPFVVIEKSTGKNVGEWINKEECARALNLDGARIGDCLRKQRKTHKGYVFINKEGH